MFTKLKSSIGNARARGKASENGAEKIGILSGISWVFDRISYRIATLGFDLVILMGMVILLVGIVLAMGGHIRILQTTVLLPISIMSLAAIIVVKRDGRSGWRHVAHILRDWIPFVLIDFIYENLHDVAGQVMTIDVAGYMFHIDSIIFGIEPTLWAQRIFSPLLTDLMSISYALYFALPLFIMFMLSIWGRRYELRHMVLALTVCFLLGFMGYVFFPCSPPRYFIENMYTNPVSLHGLFLFDRLQGAWDNLSVISGGAFPSLHVGISAVALIYAYKFRAINAACRAIWYVYIPLVVSLWFSTIYLRHHWFVDVFAGLCAALFSYVASSWMMSVWRNLRKKYDMPF